MTHPKSVDASQNPAELLPLRMLGQYVYCPRLYYWMHVEGQMVANAHVWRGRQAHARVDKQSRRAARRAPSAAAEQGPPKTWQAATSVSLSSRSLGLTGKLDTVLLAEQGQDAVPLELKSGRQPDPKRHHPPATVQTVWAADAVQLCAQAMLLEAEQYQVPHGEIYYRASRALHTVNFDTALRHQVTEAIGRAQQIERDTIPPPPLEDSPKCAGCSLLSVCMPEESALLRARAATPDAPEVTGVRRVIPAALAESSVVISTPGAQVRKDGDALAVTAPGSGSGSRTNRKEITRIPLDGLAALAITNRVSLTTSAMAACLDNGVPVAIQGGWGRLKGMIVPTFGNNAQLRVAQHRAHIDPGQCLALARALVQGKIRNQRTLIRRNADEPAIVNELAALRRAAGRADSLDSVRGNEGRAARIYFDALSRILAQRGGPQFAMDGRSRRPPKDFANTLLSFGYSVITRDLTGVAFRVGFDPFVGFLHGVGYGKPSLALDLVEEFRPLIVDSTVVRMVAQSEVKSDGFRRECGGVLMLPHARRALLKALNRRLNEQVTHPIFGYKISYRRVLEVQARLLARVLQGETDRYTAMHTR